MLAIRAALHALLFASLVCLNDEEPKIARDCAYKTCRDCCTVGCTWGIYFSGAENCIPSSRGVPGIEAEVEDPQECPKPKCVMPDMDHWDAIGLAQLLGGLFGGIFAGICGGAAFFNWRRGRVLGYERLDGEPRTWMQLATAFFGGFMERFARRDAEAPFLNAEDEDRLRREARQRINRQLDELLARQRLQNPAARNQAVDGEDRRNDNVQDPDLEGEGRRQAAVQDGGPQVDQPNMRQPGLGMQFAAVEDVAVERVEPVNVAAGVDQVQDVVVAGGSESSSSDSDAGENQNNPGPTGGGPSPLVQIVQAARKSVRHASADAKARITALKIGKKI